MDHRKKRPRWGVWQAAPLLPIPDRRCRGLKRRANLSCDKPKSPANPSNVDTIGDEGARGGRFAAGDGERLVGTLDEVSSELRHVLLPFR